MGRREAIQQFERIKTETTREMKAIKEAGGNVKFLLSYQGYLNELPRENGNAAIPTAQHFLRRPLQIAAVTAVMDQATLEAHKDDIPDFDETLSNRVRSLARAVYVSAAGHHGEQALAHLPETSPEATARKQKAAADWDRLLETSPESLAHLSLFGKEPINDQSMTLMDHVEGMGLIILFILIIVVIIVYYNWYI